MKTTTMNAETMEHENVNEAANDSGTRASGIVRAAKRSAPELDVAASMVDALEDILRWERQSERGLRVDDRAS